MTAIQHNYNGTIRGLFPQTTFIGFENLLFDLERANELHRNGCGQYPPHNVIKLDDSKFKIELAVAGFKSDQLDIEVKEQELVIKGSKEEDKREYSHKGISSRKFTRAFTLGEYVVVTGSTLVDGILAINLEIQVPEDRKPRKIKIG